MHVSFVLQDFHAFSEISLDLNFNLKKVSADALFTLTYV
jgi:hypothetical protein